jgi:hypothetical protein
MDHSLLYSKSLVFFFFFLVCTGVWAQGLVLVRQALYHLRHTSRPFSFSFFSDRVSYFYLEPALDCDLPTYAFCVAETTDTCHHTWLGRHEGLSNFLPGLASNHNTPDFHLLCRWDYRCESCAWPSKFSDLNIDLI